MSVKLVSLNGNLVTEIDSLPLDIMISRGNAPEMLCWGERFFSWNLENKTYDEGFCYFVPQMITSEQRVSSEF